VHSQITSGVLVPHSTLSNAHHYTDELGYKKHVPVYRKKKKLLAFTKIEFYHLPYLKMCQKAQYATGLRFNLRPVAY
jgi:hypothetical protein